MSEDAKTYLERAYHARMGAKESKSAVHRVIFERLAASYEKMAHEAGTSSVSPPTAAQENAPAVLDTPGHPDLR